MKLTHLMTCGALLLTASGLSAEEPAPDSADLATERAAWLADYAGLKASMQQGYANLDWILARRGLDLQALDRRTIERLQQAQARADAVAAIDDFFRAFRDPHFRPGHGPAPLRAARLLVAEKRVAGMIPPAPVARAWRAAPAA